MHENIFTSSALHSHDRRGLLYGEGESVAHALDDLSQKLKTLTKNVNVNEKNDNGTYTAKVFDLRITGNCAYGTVYVDYSPHKPPGGGSC